MDIDKNIGQPPMKSIWCEYNDIMFEYAFAMDQREAIAVPGALEYNMHFADTYAKKVRLWFDKYEKELKAIPSRGWL